MSVALISLVSTPREAQSATGINEQLNYQARLLDNAGAVVADGLYNIEYKIYQDGNGCVSGGSSPCSGTLKWTESRIQTNRVTVKNGYFSVNLGSVTAFGTSVDWNQDTLWLSINVGGTANTPTPTWDGEMTPFRRMAAVPYALNAKQLGGLDASAFVKLAPTAVQVDSGSLSSIFINKTGASGNILQLQKNTADVLTLANSGAVTFQNATDSTTGFVINDADGGTPVFNVDTTNERVGIGTASPTNTLSVNGTADIQGHAAVGAGSTVNGGLALIDSLFGVTSHNTILSAYETSTTTGSSSVSYDGLLINNILNPSGTANYGQANGMSGFLSVASGNAQDISTAGGFNGFNGGIIHGGTGTISGAATGVNGAVANLGGGTIDIAVGINAVILQTSGTINTAKGVNIAAPLNFATITNNYGLYVNDQSGAGVTDSYNIYSAGASSENYFEGALIAGSSNTVLTLSTGMIDADALTLVSAVDGRTGTSSASGLAVHSDGLGLLQGCSDGQVLGWVESTDTWDCTTVSGGSGANTALSNLSAVAINTSLLPGTDDSIDLGDNTHRFRDAYLGGETLHIGTSTTDEGIVSYTTSTNVLRIDTDSTSAGALHLGNTNASGVTLGKSGTTLTVNPTAWTATPTISGLITATSGLTSTGIIQVDTLGATNTVATLCRNSSNQLAACSSTGTGVAFVQGGNSLGATAILGTNDSNSLTFETNNITQATIAVGGAALFKNSTDSTAAFSIQNNAGTSNVLSADTTNSRVGINKATPTFTLDVSGIIATNNRYLINSTSASAGNIGKAAIVGSGGVTANDVVVLNASNEAITTTTARDTRVFGVATSTSAAAGNITFIIGGNYSVNYDTGGPTPAAGDQLVTTTVAGKVTVDNSATTGIIGYATAAGSAGLVSLSVRPIAGQYTPTFSGLITANGGISIGAQSLTGTTGIIDYTNFDVSSAGAVSSANHTITSNSANALAVGLNGTSNPALRVDASTASSATGVSIASKAAGAGARIGTISSGTDETLSISAKNAGKITLADGSTGDIEFFSSAYKITSSGALTVSSCTGCGGGGANTALSNLSGVAINTALLPGADNTIDLGSGSFSFRTAYLDTSVLTPLVDTSGALSLGTGSSTATNLGKTGTTLTFNPTAWTATPTISGLVTATSGLTVGSGSNTATLIVNKTGTATVGSPYQDSNKITLRASGYCCGGSYDVDFNIRNKMAAEDFIPRGYFALNAGSGADLFTLSQTGAVVFQPTTDRTNGFQILDANGGTPIFNVDYTNERVGIGTATPTGLLHIYEGASGISAYAGSHLVVESDNEQFISMITDDDPSGILFGNGGSGNTAVGIIANNSINLNGLEFRTGGNNTVLTLNSAGAAIFDNTTDGTSGFVINDADGGTPIFNVDTTNERVGIGTATPSLLLHLASGNTPAIRLEQNTSGGFTAQTWDIMANDAQFGIRDVTGGSTLPFRIRPGAPTSSIDIAANGDVGIGTSSPDGKLDVAGTAGSLMIVDEAAADNFDKARVQIGSAGNGLDQLYVNGRINTIYQQFWQDFMGNFATLAADGNYAEASYDEIVGTGGTSPSGSVQMVNTTSVSGVARLTFTGTLGTGPWGSNWGTAGQLKTERNLNPVIEARVLASSNTDQRAVVGFTNVATNTTVSADTNLSADEAFFRKTAAGTQWQAVSRAASGTEEVTSNVGSTSSWQLLRVELSGVNNNVKFYVNDSLVATHSTAVPTARLGWALMNTPTTTTYTGRVLDIDNVRVWSDDPPKSQGGSSGLDYQIVGDSEQSSQDGESISIDGTGTNAPNVEALIGELTAEDSSVESDSKSPAAEEPDTQDNSSSTLTDGTLNVDTANIALDLSVNGSLFANGALKVTGPAEFLSTSVFYKLATFIDKTIFRNDVNFEGDVNIGGKIIASDNSAGTVEIVPGQTTVSVVFTKPYDKEPVINVTPVGIINPKYGVVDITKQGFTIQIDPAQPDKLKFNWIAVQNN